VRERDAVRPLERRLRGVRQQRGLRRHRSPALRPRSQSVRGVREQRALRAERTDLRPRSRRVRAVRHQWGLPFVSADLHVRSQVPSGMSLRSKLQRRRALLQRGDRRMRRVPRRERLPRPCASPLPPRPLHAVRGRVNVPVERTLLLQRALRRMSRRLQLSEHRTALQKRHLRPLRARQRGGGRRDLRGGWRELSAFCSLCLFQQSAHRHSTMNVPSAAGRRERRQPNFGLIRV